MQLNYIEWHVTPFRAEQWLEIWRPALDRALAAGASTCYLTRNIDDPLHFRQVSVWEDPSDFEPTGRRTRSRAFARRRWPTTTSRSSPVWHSLAAEAALDRSA